MVREKVNEMITNEHAYVRIIRMSLNSPEN